MLPEKQPQQTYNILLEERDADDTYSILVKGVPSATLAVRADSFPQTRRFFIGANGENRRCDFILISNSGRRDWILFIDLKNGKIDKNRAKDQLRGGYCLVRYCAVLAHTFQNDEIEQLCEYEERYVCINLTNRKRPFSSDTPSLHDNPQDMLTIKTASTVHFKHLCHGSK